MLSAWRLSRRKRKKVADVRPKGLNSLRELLYLGAGWWGPGSHTTGGRNQKVARGQKLGKAKKRTEKSGKKRGLN